MATDLKRWHGTVPDFPHFYDILHGDNQNDVSFYLEVCKDQRHVLECGIGTGRVALPLARDGIRVHGIDNSEHMLRELLNKLENESLTTQGHIQFELADMRHFQLGHQFDVAIIPYMTFNYLGSFDDQLNTLRSVRAHLCDGSRLYIELISMFPPWFCDDGIFRLVARKEQSDGTTIEIHRVTRFDASTQILEHDRLFKTIDENGSVVGEVQTTLRNRFMMLGEVTLILERSGFTVENVWGAHDKTPYTKQSQVMLIAAKKVGGLAL